MSGAMLSEVLRVAATTEVPLALVAGVACGLAAGLTPGINGRVALMLSLPLALLFGPVAGAVFLVAMHAVVHTSSAIPAILLGVPTSPSEAATVIDGYAMTLKGQGARAIGVIVGASMGGGVIGALLLLLAAPLAPGAVRFIGSPEVAALALLGLLSIAALSGGGLAAGLMSAALGIVVASVGVDAFSGADRFTFGDARLADGVAAVAVVTGLFVTPELLLKSPARAPASVNPRIADVLAGFREAFRTRWLLIRTSLLGAVVGFAPGLGASVAVWLAYGHARQTHASDVPYGEGAAAGVIAPEAANNSKEGGALAPALFLGLPTSSGMGILLAAFATLGVEVGPRMVADNPGFISLMGLTIVAANLLAAPVCLLLAAHMVRFAGLRPTVIGPVALAGAVAAAALAEPGGDVLGLVAVFSVIGLLLKAADIPRAPMLLGFVLAPSLESGLFRSAMISGWEALARPGVIAIALCGLMALIPVIVRRRRPPSSMESPASMALAAPPVAGLIAAGLALGGVSLAGTPLTAWLIPGTAMAVGLAAAGVMAFRLWRTRGEPRVSPPDYNWPALGLLAVTLAVTPITGIAIAAAAFVFVVLRFQARLGLRAAGATAIALGVAIHLLGLTR